MPEIHAVGSDHRGAGSVTWHIVEEDGGCPEAPAIPEEGDEPHLEDIDTAWPNWRIEEALLSEGDELCEECFPFPPEE